MRRKTCQYALLSALLVVGMFSPILGFAEKGCVCFDPPDDPCIAQALTLTSIEFPHQVLRDGEYVDSCYHSALYEPFEDSEVWVIIQVEPGGDCYECAQTYVLYRPRLDVKSAEGFEFAVNDPGFTASNVVFSMTECSPLTPYKVTAAIIEEDQSYMDVLKRLARIVPLRGLAVLDRTGSHGEEAAEEKGWSMRIEAPILQNIYHAIVYDAYQGNKPEDEWERNSNDIVLGIASWSVHGLNVVGLVKSPRLPKETGKICLCTRASSEEVSGGSGCSREDAARETQAEAFQKTVTLNNSPEAPHPPPLQQIINNSPSGFHYYGPGSANLPKNSVGMEVTKRTIVKTGPNNSTVILKLAVVVIRFEDYSDYVYWGDVEECSDQEGNITSGTYDRGDGASRIGSKRSRSRSDFWKADILQTHRYVWGSSVGSPLALSEIIDLSTADGPSVDEIVITTGAGGTLDLTGLGPASSLFGTSGSVKPSLVANDAITIYADDILLDPGDSLSDLMSPVPTVKPGIDGFHLILPEGVGVLTGEDILPIGVMSWSSSPQTVSLSWQDSRGWVAPGTMPVYLPAGGMTVVNLLIHVPEGADLISSSSMLTFTGISQSLGSTESICELIASTSVDADDVLAQPTEEAPAEPAVVEEPAEPGIPEEILACTEDLGEASGTDYKNSGLRRYKVSPSKRLKFFKDEIDAYLDCNKLGPCARTVKAWLQQASLELQKELAEIFYTAFQKANR